MLHLWAFHGAMTLSNLNSRSILATSTGLLSRSLNAPGGEDDSERFDCTELDTAPNPIYKGGERCPRGLSLATLGGSPGLRREVQCSPGKRVVEVLLQAGAPTLAPILSPYWAKQTSEGYGFASNWSERHAAHAGGLGTFGLCDGLITPLGKAVRTGSVVAKLQVPPTLRPYQDHRAYCLYYSHGICQKCVQRCPVKAISSQGHDKTRCFGHLESSRRYTRREYGIKKGGCGLCQVAVPCESHIPSPEEG